MEGSPGEDASNSRFLGGSAANMAGSNGVPGAASNDASNPSGGYILNLNARAGSAIDSAVNISLDTSQGPHKTMQFTGNARKPLKLDLGSRPAFQLPKNHYLVQHNMVSGNGAPNRAARTRLFGYQV